MQMQQMDLDRCWLSIGILVPICLRAPLEMRYAMNRLRLVFQGILESDRWPTMTSRLRLPWISSHDAKNSTTSFAVSDPRTRRRSRDCLAMQQLRLFAEKFKHIRTQAEEEEDVLVFFLLFFLYANNTTIGVDATWSKCVMYATMSAVSRCQRRQRRRGANDGV